MGLQCYIKRLINRQWLRIAATWLVALDGYHNYAWQQDQKIGVLLFFFFLRISILIFFF